MTCQNNWREKHVHMTDSDFSGGSNSTSYRSSVKSDLILFPRRRLHCIQKESFSRIPEDITTGQKRIDDS